MKIKVSQGELTKTIQRLIGIDIIIDTVDEARRALNLILERTETAKHPDYEALKEMKITQRVEHASTAMEHQTVFVIEFTLDDEAHLSMEIALIKELQRLFKHATV